MYSHFQEAHRWWQRLRTGSADLHPALAASALASSAAFAWFSGHHAEVMPLAEAGAALSREVGDRRSLITLLAMLFQMEHDRARRLQLAEEEERVARELGATWWVAAALWNKGMALGGQDDRAARTAYEESAALFRSTGDAWGRVWMLTAVAEYARRQGQDATVTRLLEESLTLARRLGDRSTISQALRGLGASAYRQGNLERARQLLRESLAAQEEAGNRPMALEVLVELGQVALAQDDLERAMEIVDEALAGSRSLGSEAGIVSSTRALRLAGQVARARGQLDQARALLRESLAYARERDVYLAVEVVESLAGVLAAGGAGDIEARLWGAASAVGVAEGWPLPPVARASYDCDVAAASAQLGETAFAAAWAEGQAMPLEQAIAYALEDEDQCSIISDGGSRQ
jgi:tetratricopeptide (TPR) repeat protein